MGTQTFSFTGGQQTWVVPSGITVVIMECYGAAPSSGTAKGGYAKGNITVTEGQTLYIYVGGKNGYNGGGANNGGGGGGGATDIRRGGAALSNRIIVAGGAGAMDGGDGGGLTGSNGGPAMNGVGSGVGAGQNYGYALGLGEPGYVDTDPAYIGVGGGGGGGYYGGNSGSSGYENGGNGGGGSSYIAGLSSASTTAGVNSGDGYVVLTYSEGVPALTVSPTIMSVSTVAATFNAVLGTAMFSQMDLQSTSSVATTFALIPMVYIYSMIQSSSTVTANVISPQPIDFGVSILSLSTFTGFVKIVLPAYLLLRGNVTLDGVPVSNAFVRVLSDDGSSVYTAVTDNNGDYEVEVTRDGIYHVICYKQDTNGNIFSAPVQPYVVVEQQEVGAV